MNQQHVDMDMLVASLADTFPARSDVPLALSLLRALAEGSPVSTEALARRSGMSQELVAERLAAWPTIEHDEDDRIVAFTGLSLRPTTHTFCLGDRELFTWCAWDALFLPELLERTAHVQSTCPATGRRISLTVTPETVVDVTPAEAVVSMVHPRSAHDIRSAFCCHVNFFASADAGRTWTASHAGGALLSVADAHELGRRTNARFFAPDHQPTPGATP